MFALGRKVAIIVLNEQSTEMTRSQIYLEFQSQRVTKILTASNFFKKNIMFCKIETNCQ